MSGPPHHHQNRQPGTGNAAWNHLQVPNFFPPRQPQHAHMSTTEHHLLHQPTWHTPTTTDATPIKQPSHLFNLEQMLTERQFVGRLVQTPGVDLTLQRNGSSGCATQNGDMPITPISLSVRDANKINSLPPSALEVQTFEVAKCVSPTQRGKCPSPSSPSTSPSLDNHSALKNAKRPSKRVDSILERLAPEKLLESAPKLQESDSTTMTPDNNACVAPPKGGVIVQAAGVMSATSNEENSSPSPLQTAGHLKEDDSVSLGSNEDRSACSNEDSLDGGKSRRKRKPTKTMRVNKEEEVVEIPVEIEVYVPKDGETETNDVVDGRLPVVGNLTNEENKERRRSNSVPPSNPPSPRKNRRKTSSESETIANIAAMVQSESTEAQSSKAVSVIKSKETLEGTENNCGDRKTDRDEEDKATPVQQHVIITPAQKKIVTNTHFVEVENKLEEMFAGLEDDTTDPLKAIDGRKNVTKVAEEERANQAQAQDVTSTSSDFSTSIVSEKPMKRGTSKASSRRSSECSSLEAIPKSKKTGKKRKTSGSPSPAKQSKIVKAKKTPKQAKAVVDQIKDVYAYDSGSNASSGKSKGPFIQIRGPRDSPLSVCVVNAPSNDEEGAEKRTGKGRKYHDDSEYRHKVRSKGLHCSTLSNKYDSQTRDASWICAFCKRGPHWCSGGKGPDIVAGDLFGPYIITTKCQEYERRLDDPFDKNFKSKKVSRSLEAPLGKSSKKWKRKHSESFLEPSAIPSCPQESAPWSDHLLGIADTGSGSFEVWAHEDCIVWSQGVYLVGARIVGLEEAIWTSCNVPCDRCKLKGANLCCLKRGCSATAHYGCAVETGWDLDEDKYVVYCAEHKK